jgi:hypothetical protein
MDKEKTNGTKVQVSTPIDLEIVNGVKDGEVQGKGWTMKRKWAKVHNNDPCTCGSGKKAKKCCYRPLRNENTNL